MVSPYKDIAIRSEKSRVLATMAMADESIPCAGGFAFYAGKGGFLNRACGVGLAPHTDEELDALVRFYEERDEEASVELSPYVDQELVKALGHRGFVLKHVVHAFALRLIEVEVEEDSHQREPPPLKESNAVTIERLTTKTPELVLEIVEANERGFDTKHTHLSAELTIKLATRAVMAKTTDGFFARSKATNEIVGVGLAGTHEGITTLFGATTATDYRGQGIQRSLMQKRIELARTERGSEYAVVLTSPGKTTEHNAIALGFHLAYTHIALRRPRNPPSQ